MKHVCAHVCMHMYAHTHAGRVQRSGELPTTSPSSLQRHWLAVLSGAICGASSTGSCVHIWLCPSRLFLSLHQPHCPGFGTYQKPGLQTRDPMTWQKSQILPIPLPKAQSSQEGAWEVAFEVRLHLFPLPSEWVCVFLGSGCI